MGLLGNIGNYLSNLDKPGSFVKGEDFENYVSKYMFPDSDYELIYRTSSYSQNKDRFATASMKPDFHFEKQTLGGLFSPQAPEPGR